MKRPRAPAMRALPSVGRLLELPEAAAALSRLPRAVLVDGLRQAVERARQAAADGVTPPPPEALAAEGIDLASASMRPSLRRAINATGVVLHTGLGRAPLAAEAAEAVAAVASGHCALEVDPDTGRRGHRQAHVSALLCALTGAEAALVVNNNAAAVLLAVMALAAGREVVIARGELVEIGGAFRLPDVIAAGGATLVEVGTTNRTRVDDYTGAVTERTAAFLRCHPSNYRVVGFCEAPPAEALAGAAHARGLVLIDDLGSGALVDTASLGAGPTVTLAQAIAAGADVVTASGDKLLGGPQCGIAVGRADLVARMARHPLARAVRIDKLNLAALEATLRLYADPERARAALPVLRALGRTPAELAASAGRVAEAVRSSIGASAMVDVVEERSQVGGGSLPGEDLPTWCVRIRPRSASADELARQLRQGAVPVYGRIRDDALLLDPRTMDEGEAHDVAALLAAGLVGLEEGDD